MDSSIEAIISSEGEGILEHQKSSPGKENSAKNETCQKATGTFKVWEGIKTYRKSLKVFVKNTTFDFNKSFSCQVLFLNVYHLCSIWDIYVCFWREWSSPTK